MTIQETSKRLTESLKKEVRRRIIEESITRTKKCLGLLSEADIWQRPNSQLASMGNLVLHLCGNARQWIISGIGNAADERDRDSEFDELGPISREKLFEMLDELQADLEAVIGKIEAEDLLRPIGVQGFEENGLSILVHVTEHFSYHVGQISWYTKLVKETDLEYYEKLDLNAKG